VIRAAHSLYSPLVAEPDREYGGDRPVLAIDIGGTKIAAGLVDPHGTVAVARRRPTPRGEGADAETLWVAVFGLVR
jgi:glucokinase